MIWLLIMGIMSLNLKISLKFLELYLINLNIASNNIAIEYNNASGADDTIHALYIGGGDNAVVENNNISIKGHTYVYGITIDGKNFTIASNAFYSDSDNN